MDFLKQRVTVMPMRELLTEYKSVDAKRRLVNGFDLFMADHSLMNNKFKELIQFLGAKFWHAKKVPIPLDLKAFNGKALGDEIERILSGTELYVSGNGVSQSVKIGLISMSDRELAENLSFVLAEIRKRYDRNVCVLRLKTEKSMAVPFYCDLESANELDNGRDLAPRSKTLKESNPDVEDDFPLMNTAQLTVTATGDLIVSHKRTITDEDDDHDVLIDGLEAKWIERSKRKEIDPSKTRMKIRPRQVKRSRKLMEQMPE